MKALVTGVDGFVGPYLIEELQSKGYETAGTYRDNPRIPLNIKTYQMDLLDKKQVNDVFEDYKPDVIVHLAGISSPHYSIKHPKETIKVNFEGTKNVLKAARSCKILLISSAEMYGIPQSIPIKEDHPLKPQTPYAESKVMVERYAQELVKGGYGIIFSRSFNHIGPGQSENFVTSSFAKQIADIESGSQEPTIMVGNLDAKRDFTDVRDVVKAYSSLLENGRIGEVYNVCSGEAYQIKEILDYLLSLSKVKIDVKEDPERMRPSEIPTNLGDNSKISREIGWKPKIDIKKSLEQILDYWRKNESSNSTSLRVL